MLYNYLNLLARKYMQSPAKSTTWFCVDFSVAPAWLQQINVVVAA